MWRHRRWAVCSVANLIAWRGNVWNQIGNATRHRDVAVEWGRKVLSATYAELASSGSFPNIDRKLATSIVKQASKVLTGQDKTHIALARTIVQAQEAASQLNTLPSGRQLLHKVLEYYTVDAEEHGGRFTYEDLTAIVIRGESLERFLQDWEAGMLACGSFVPDPQWLHSHFASQVRKAKKFEVDWNHYQHARTLPKPNDHSLSWLHEAAWRLVRREREERNRIAQTGGAARVNGAREDTPEDLWHESAVNRKKRVKAEKAAEKAKKEKAEEKAAKKQERLRAEYGKAGGKGEGKGQNRDSGKGGGGIPKEVFAEAKDKSACARDMCGTCTRKDCSFTHGVAPSESAKRLIAEWKKNGGHTKGDKGGKGGGGKGASGGKGSKEPTQRMLDLAKKAVAETGKKPECWYHKKWWMPLQGVPILAWPRQWR